MPVCQIPMLDAGTLTDDAGSPCPPVGSSCSVEGQECGTANTGIDCGAIEICASQDPTKPPYVCPL
jgi:hypothetical protein